MNFLLLAVGIIFIFLICRYYYQSSKPFNRLMAILLFGIIVGAGINLAREKLAKSNSERKVEIKASSTTRSSITSFVWNVNTNDNFESNLMSRDINLNYFLTASALCVGNTHTEYINDS